MVYLYKVVIEFSSEDPSTAGHPIPVHVVASNGLQAFEKALPAATGAITKFIHKEKLKPILSEATRVARIDVP
jgi:hypothetical protein